MLNFKDLGTRILSGIVFIAILIGGILFNQHSFFIVFLIILTLALSEFYGLLSKAGDSSLSKVMNVIGGIALFAGSYCFFSSANSSLLVLVPFIIYLLALFISELFLKRPNPIHSLAYAILGQIYITLPLSLLSYLAFGYDFETGGYHYAYLLALFIFIWVNDSFAYLFGSAFGKHKMFERISPKKSWEGFAGGAICAIIASVIYAQFYTQVPVVGWIGFAIVMVVFGTLGDLIESLFKRTLNVKDSGNLIPGHGGILDRIDSVLFAVPAQFVYVELLTYFLNNK